MDMYIGFVFHEQNYQAAGTLMSHLTMLGSMHGGAVVWVGDVGLKATLRNQHTDTEQCVVAIHSMEREREALEGLLVVSETLI